MNTFQEAVKFLLQNVVKTGHLPATAKAQEYLDAMEAEEALERRPMMWIAEPTKEAFDPIANAASDAQTPVPIQEDELKSDTTQNPSDLPQLFVVKPPADDEPASIADPGTDAHNAAVNKTK